MASYSDVLRERSFLRSLSVGALRVHAFDHLVERRATWRLRIEETLVVDRHRDGRDYICCTRSVRIGWGGLVYQFCDFAELQDSGASLKLALQRART